MFTVEEVKVGNAILMLFWQLLQHEHKIAIQGTESKELHRIYLGSFCPSFAYEVQYHELTLNEKLRDTTIFTQFWGHLHVFFSSDN